MQFATWVALAVMIATTSVARTEPRWPDPDPVYAFVPALGCGQARSSASADACADQMAVFTAARAQAVSGGKNLLVVFGATWCPSCKSLKRALPQAMAEAGLAERLHVVEITISTLAQGKVTAVPSGDAVRGDLMRARPEFRQRAIPFLALINPASGRTSARNLDDLEQNGAWNGKAIAQVVAFADAETRGGPPAPSEPSWLSRKWRRWIGL